MKTPAQEVIAFVKCQKRAFKEFGLWDDAKEKAGEKVLRVCGFFMKTPKTGWIQQIKEEVLELLPSEENEAKKELRSKILNLFN